MSFWRGVFSNNGQPSFSRVATAFLVVAAIAWTSVIVWRTHTLPDFVGLIGFMASLYGVNVAGNVGKSITNGNGNGNGNGGTH